MAIRNDFAPGEVLAAADLNDTFGSKLDYPAGGANGDALIKDGTAALWGSAGKIRQVVRSTDTTARSTTSDSFVDASISVTVTPQKSDSAILLIWSVRVASTLGSPNGTGARLQITDNSNNAISGAQEARISAAGNGWTTASIAHHLTIIGYATPATTSATTFKGRFRREGGTATLNNNDITGQLYAIEVSA
jgi:hypothetical protein